MSKKNIRLLLVLLGVVILLAGYMAVYLPYTERTETVNSEREALLPELTELQDHYNNLELYYTGIEDSQKTMQEETARYDADVRNEDLILYATALRDSTGAALSGIAFGGTEELLAYPELGADGAVSGAYRHVWKNGMTLTLDMRYDQMKDLIDFVNRSEPRTALENLSIAYAGETGSLSGTATINKYFIAGADYSYTPTFVPGISVGTDDLFGTVDAAAAPDGEDAQSPENAGVVVLD